MYYSRVFCIIPKLYPHFDNVVVYLAFNFKQIWKLGCSNYVLNIVRYFAYSKGSTYVIDLSLPMALDTKSTESLLPKVANPLSYEL